jgi:hypothetical protein
MMRRNRSSCRIACSLVVASVMLAGCDRWDTSVWREKSGRTLLAVPRHIRGGKDHDDRVMVRLEYSVAHGE